MDLRAWPRPRRRASSPLRRGSPSERGAAIVELALVAPLVAGLLIGVIEAGWFMQTYLTLEEVTREGARTLAVNGTEPDADHQVLEIIDAHLGANDRDVVTRVVLFEASSLDDEPSTACTTGAAPGSVADGCSIYLGSDLGKAAAALTCGWCPTDRVPGAKLGVWIEMTYSSPTGVMSDRDISDHSVQVLEQGTS